MSQFEFIAVLVSIVTGLGVVRLLSGLAQFLSRRHKSYWVHLLWTWNVFHSIVFFWWFFWRWSTISEWNLLLFLFVLVYSVVMYLLCALLYPAGESRTDFEEIYYEKRAWFFGLWVLVMIIDIIDTNWKMYYGMSGFGLFLVTVWGLIIAGSLIAARTANRYFHAAWAAIYFLIVSTGKSLTSAYYAQINALLRMRPNKSLQRPLLAESCRSKVPDFARLNVRFGEKRTLSLRLVKSGR